MSKSSIYLQKEKIALKRPDANQAILSGVRGEEKGWEVNFLRDYVNFFFSFKLLNTMKGCMLVILSKKKRKYCGRVPVIKNAVRDS